MLDSLDVLLHILATFLVLMFSALFLIISSLPSWAFLIPCGMMVLFWFFREMKQAKRAGYVEWWNPFKWSTQKTMEWAMPAGFAVYSGLLYML